VKLPATGAPDGPLAPWIALKDLLAKLENAMGLKLNIDRSLSKGVSPMQSPKCARAGGRIFAHLPVSQNHDELIQTAHLTRSTTAYKGFLIAPADK
jgi:hypothetical protein